MNRFVNRVLVAALVAASPLAAADAVAQRMVCGPRDPMVEQLGRVHGETTVAVGLVSEGEMLEILSTPDGASWTLLRVKVDGTACVQGSGFDLLMTPALQGEAM